MTGLSFQLAGISIQLAIIVWQLEKTGRVLNEVRAN